MDKKAGSEMWWIIIGAVIALVVLVVLMVMFGEKSSKLGGGLLECQSKSGKCVDKDSCESVYKGSVSGAFECEEGKECCFGAKEASS